MPNCSGDFQSFCLESIDHHPLGVIFEFFLLFYAFIALATICDEYLVPSLETLCVRWNIREDVAGATFMAFGSAAPEIVISAITTFTAGDEGTSDTGTAAIMGSGMIAFTVVPALCVLLSGQVRPLQIKRRPLARDIIFYTIALVCMMVFIRDGKVTAGEAVTLVIFYLVYIIAVVVSPRIRLWYQLRQLQGEERVQFLKERSTSFVEKARLERAESKSKRNSTSINAMTQPLLSDSNTVIEVDGPAVPKTNAEDITTAAATRQEQSKASRSGGYGPRRFSAIPLGKAQADAAAAGALTEIGDGGSDSDDEFQVNARPNSSATKEAVGSYQPPAAAPAPVLTSVAANDSSQDASSAPVTTADEGPKDASAKVTVSNDTSQTSTAPVAVDGLKAAESNSIPSATVAEAETDATDAAAHTQVTEASMASSSSKEASPDVAEAPGQSTSVPLVEGAKSLPIEEKTITEAAAAAAAAADKPRSSISKSRDRSGSARRKSVTFAQDLPPDTEGGKAHELQEIVEGGVYSHTRYTDSDGAETDGFDSRDDEERLTPDEVAPLDIPVIRSDDADDDDDDESEPSSAIGRFVETVSIPLRLLFKYTNLDTRIGAKHERLYFVGFVLSFAWVALISMLIAAIIDRWGELSGIPDAFLGVAVVSIGAEIPDIIQSVTVARRGYGSMAVSNCIGAQITNILVGLGLPWALSNAAYNKPVEIPGKHRIIRTAGILLTCVVIFACLTIGLAIYNKNNKVQLARWKGFITITCYVVGIAIFSGVTLCKQDWC